MTNATLDGERRTLRLRRGKERVAANRHPWIFAGAVDAESGPYDVAFGDLVDDAGAVVASGFYSQASQIRLRALSFGEPFTVERLRERIGAAIARRRQLLSGSTNAVRLINAEGDDLSGIVADLYDDVLVLEIASAGAERLREVIAAAIGEQIAVRAVHFKNDIPVRRLEQLSMEPQSTVGDVSATVRENGLQFFVDPAAGQKTGFFLDQRDNRQLARELAGGRSVLNLFSYTGAFGVYAAAGGAVSVENVDSSSPALEVARRNHAMNGSEATQVAADAFQYVRKSTGRFGLVVCDPPAFAKSRGEVERAARGYKDINLFAMRLVERGGLMMTFSCSGHMSLDLFQKVLFSAAVDAGRRVSFVRRLTAASDHPVSLYCPEGEYLKGFLVEMLD